MQSKLAFVGLGGNLGASLSILKQALEEIRGLDPIGNLASSNFYETTPVSPIPQPNYINAVCSFDTTYSPQELHAELQAIERKLGKEPKAKDAPRVIDLDILLFGTEWVETPLLQIPHPRWKERLFVLKPLSDLRERLLVPIARDTIIEIDLRNLLDNFVNPHCEQVRVVA